MISVRTDGSLPPAAGVLTTLVLHDQPRREVVVIPEEQPLPAREGDRQVEPTLALSGAAHVREGSRCWRRARLGGDLGDAHARPREHRVVVGVGGENRRTRMEASCRAVVPGRGPECDLGAGEQARGCLGAGRPTGGEGDGRGRVEDVPRGRDATALVDRDGQPLDGTGGRLHRPRECRAPDARRARGVADERVG